MNPVPHLTGRPAFTDFIDLAGKPSVGTLKSDLFGTKPVEVGDDNSCWLLEPKIRVNHDLSFLFSGTFEDDFFPVTSFRL